MKIYEKWVLHKTSRRGGLLRMNGLSLCATSKHPPPNILFICGGNERGFAVVCYLRKHMHEMGIFIGEQRNRPAIIWTSNPNTSFQRIEIPRSLATLSGRFWSLYRSSWRWGKAIDRPRYTRCYVCLQNVTSIFVFSSKTLGERERSKT